MTYEEAIEIEITREEAMQEIAKHDGETFETFLQDVGDRRYYTGKVVLDWLGY